MTQMYTNVLLHIVFSTKERQNLLTPELKKRLFPYMQGIIKEQGGRIYYINGPSDHVHLLISIPTTKTIADIMKNLKAYSSKLINDQKLAKTVFAWQTGYEAFSISDSDKIGLIKYIAEQEEHHKTNTFEQEFLQILEKYGVQYDPAYLWK